MSFEQARAILDSAAKIERSYRADLRRAFHALQEGNLALAELLGKQAEVAAHLWLERFEEAQAAFNAALDEREGVVVPFRARPDSPLGLTGLTAALFDIADAGSRVDPPCDVEPLV